MKMREIDVKEITETVKKLCVEANTAANKDLKDKLSESLKNEKSPAGRAVLNQLLKNLYIAETEKIPICKDPGFTVDILAIGIDVALKAGL